MVSFSFWKYFGEQSYIFHAVSHLPCASVSEAGEASFKGTSYGVTLAKEITILLGLGDGEGWG